MCPNLKVDVVDPLKDDGGRVRVRVLDNVEHADDVHAARQVLQDLDLALNLLALHGLSEGLQGGTREPASGRQIL